MGERWKERVVCVDCRWMLGERAPTRSDVRRCTHETVQRAPDGRHPVTGAPAFRGRGNALVLDQAPRCEQVNPWGR